MNMHGGECFAQPMSDDMLFGCRPMSDDMCFGNRSGGAPFGTQSTHLQRDGADKHSEQGQMPFSNCSVREGSTSVWNNKERAFGVGFCSSSGGNGSARSLSTFSTEPCGPFGARYSGSKKGVTWAYSAFFDCVLSAQGACIPRNAGLK